jgi:hypothetical protein
MYSVRKFATMATIILSLLLTGMQPLTARPMIRYASLFQGGAVINGGFDSFLNNWTVTSGLAVVKSDTDPNNLSNQVAVLKAGTSYISRIEQTVTGLTPGKYALYIEKSRLTSNPGAGTYTTTATVVVPTVGTSPSNTIVNTWLPWTTPPYSGGSQGFTVDFCVPAGQSSATIKISVTGSGMSSLTRRDIEIDTVSIISIGGC